MFIPIMYRTLEISGSSSAVGALRGDSVSTPLRASQRPLTDHPVTEELLDEMGKALAKRLNALVDALDQQEQTP
ncbi:MAG: hypothetical protein ACXW15_12070 [Acidimicrobiia bacterium]